MAPSNTCLHCSVVWKELVLMEGICSIILESVYTNSKELRALVIKYEIKYEMHSFPDRLCDSHPGKPSTTSVLQRWCNQNFCGGDVWQLFWTKKKDQVISLYLTKDNRGKIALNHFKSFSYHPNRLHLELLAFSTSYKCWEINYRFAECKMRLNLP